MNKFATPRIAEGVYAIGSIDWKRRIFDALAPTPLGTTYNAYLVRGTEKAALIDTVHAGYETEYSGKIDQLLGSHAIDYVIMNHAEPDHAGTIPHILARCNARLLTTKKGAELAGSFYNVSPERIDIVGDGDSIELGGKTLRFIPAPFIHWPETMMTWLEEDRILFSCDFFASHNTTGFSDDIAQDVIGWAGKYYAEIMMPLAKPSRQAMDKIKNLDIALIAPSHGPIYLDPKPILDHYHRWTNGQTRNKAVVFYVSMYGTVEKMTRSFVEVLNDAGVETFVFDLANRDLGEIPGHLLDTRAIVMATPTVLGGMHPLANYAALTIKTIKPPVKYGAFINNYGWGKGAVRKCLEFFEEAKIEPAGTVEINGRPAETDYDSIQTLARQLAQKIQSAEQNCL